MSTNQQPNKIRSVRRSPIMLILQPREMTEQESTQYESWCDRKQYDQEIKEY